MVTLGLNANNAPPPEKLARPYIEGADSRKDTKIGTGRS
jgi:hypothetical protein